MVVIGVTGSFGTGKTTVCQILADLGAAVINADKSGHQLLEEHNEIRKRLVALFGTSILKANNSIDRKKLAEVAFNSKANREKLNSIMHPEIYKIVQKEIDKYRTAGCSVVAVEAALLIEAGWEKLVDQIWVTVAPQSTIIERLQSQRGFTKGEITGRLATQISSDDKVKHADVVINTDCSREKLKQEITELWQRLNTLKKSTHPDKE